MADLLRQEWGTPRPVFDVLHREYGFTIDVCASALNRKLNRYLTKEDDALSCRWSGERPYSNPPFLGIDPWLEHALEGELTYFLLPARTFNLWWLKWASVAKRKEWFVGRMRFEPPPGVKPSSNNMPIVGLVFGDLPAGPDIFRDARTGERILDVATYDQVEREAGARREMAGGG